MIYRVIAEPARGGGKFFYHVEGALIGGLSSEPLFDACRQLKRMGVDPAALCALFHEGSAAWAMRCPVWAGAELTAGDGTFRPHHKSRRNA